MPELDTTMQVIVKILAGSHGVIVLPTIAIWCHLASSSIWLKGQCVKCQAASWRCATPPLSRPAPVAIGDIWAMSAHIALFSVSSRNCFLFFGLHMRGKKNVARMGGMGVAIKCTFENAYQSSSCIHIYYFRWKIIQNGMNALKSMQAYLNRTNGSFLR